MANIIVCTIERFPPKWDATLKIKDNITTRFISNLSHNESLYLKGDTENVKTTVEEVLRKKRYKIKEINSKEGVAFYASKGMIGRFGSDMVHIALLLILSGALIGSFWGYKDFAILYVGSATRIPNTSFMLRLNKFWVEHYDTGQIKQYNSVITVIDNGKEVIKDKHIWVNEPLHYKGITFYQSSYGKSWDRIEYAELRLRKKDGTIVSDVFNIKWQEKVNVPNTTYSIKLLAFVADFAYDKQTNSIVSQSGDYNNPAIQVEVFDNDKLISRPWLFFNYPDLFSIIPGTENMIIFGGYKGVQYSGLSVNKDPGTGVVWLGSAIMVIGFLLAFFVFHKRFWVIVANGNDSTRLLLGGMTNKNRVLFDREFNNIVSLIKRKVSLEE